EAALRAFQTSAGLPVTGRVDADTETRLRPAPPPPAPSPTPAPPGPGSSEGAAGALSGDAATARLR
ncbi:MAG TPA: spore cortex-lytic enzyme, partial [Planctomycetes bacterium]|nr:spore cortex-lytic enzyme [Planctomycetota bacterium]